MYLILLLKKITLQFNITTLLSLGSLGHFIRVVTYPALCLSLIIQYRSTLFHLFHEAFAQTYDLGEKDGIVGEVRAQVTQHGEHVLREILETLDRRRSLPVPQQLRHGAFCTFRDPSPATTTQLSVHFQDKLNQQASCFLALWSTFRIQ